MKNKIVNHERKNRTAAAAWIVALAVFAAGLAGGLLTYVWDSGNKKAQLESMYESRVYELSDSLNNMEVGLSKLLISTCDKQNHMTVLDLYRQAEISVSALSALPGMPFTYESAYKFLNQTADWCVGFMNVLSRGGDCSDYKSSTESLYITARLLSNEVKDYAERISTGQLNLLKMNSEHPPVERGEHMSHHSVEYPELIYDGPFSDNITPRKYHGLGEQTYTAEQAADEVKKLLPELGIGDVTLCGTSGGDETAYELMAHGRHDAYLSVTKHGARVLNLEIMRETGKRMLGEQSAKDCAEAIARRFGFDVKPVWYSEFGDVAYVNLAPVADGAVLYTDLVKVKVALDNGDVLGLESSAYCMNHRSREIKTTISEQTAAASVSDKLKIESVRPAVIPMSGGSEALCYEVAGEYKGLGYFVYVDAHDGSQLRVLRVVDDGQGKLVV